MKAIVSFSGRILARLHLWRLALAAFSFYRPVSSLKSASQGRLEYAFLMSRDQPLAKQAFARLLRSGLGQSQETDLWLAKIAWSLGRLKLASLIYAKTERYAGPLSAVAGRQRTFAQDCLDHRLEARLAESIDKLSLSPAADAPLILTAVSMRYYDMFQLWSEQLDRHYPCRRLLLALDPEAASRLRRLPGADVIDLSPFFLFLENGYIHPYTRGNLWILRVLILKELVKRGFSALSLDLDAMVVGDLAAMIQRLPTADIVVQQDYSIPMDVARKFGFVLCCGFMLIRPNPSTVALLERYAEWTTIEMDDQLALNHFLAATGLSGIQREKEYMQFHSAGVSWLCPDKTLVSRDIQYGSVVRHFQQSGQSMDELKMAIRKTSL